MITLVDRADIDVLSRGSHHLFGPMRESGNDLVQDGEMVGFFDGVNTVLDSIAEYMPTPRKDKSSTDTGRGDFNSFETYEQAFNTYRHDPSAVRKFEEADLELTDADAAGIAVEYGVTGDYLDVGRYLEGEPEAFGVMANGNPRGRRVNILFNIDAVWSLAPETINARGHRMQRLVDWLEARQVRTALTAVSSATCAHVEIVVKHHDEQLDMNDIAVVGHGDFFRRMIFRFMEYSDRWRGGYGHAFHLAGYLENQKLKLDEGQELTIVVSNQIQDTKHVNSEFDKAEKKLAEALSSPWIEDHQRVIRLFRER